MFRSTVLASTATVTCLTLLVAVGPAAAGPCENDITELQRQIDNPTGKSSGTLSAAVPGGTENTAPAPDQTAGSPDPAPSGTEAGKTSGAGATSEMNAASSQIATSAQDVRLQQAGKPTTAQGGNPNTVDDQLRQVAEAVARAKELDAKNDAGCQSAVDEARNLMRAGG
jgi:hypothetical protein